MPLSYLKLRTTSSEKDLKLLKKNSVRLTSVEMRWMETAPEMKKKNSLKL